MNIFFTADTHFDHANIIRFCDRPYIQKGDLSHKGGWADKEIAQKRVFEMNRDMVCIWNLIVMPNDLVYILGDFAWRNCEKWVRLLNGRKVLILGNHDKESRVGKCFDEVHKMLEGRICGQQMTLCHYPMRSWNASFHGSWCLCGHNHGTCRASLPGEIEGGLLLDVGWDVWGRPLLFEEVAIEMQKKIEKRNEGDRI